MRTAKFEVPAAVFGEFAEKLQETDLSNRVLGTNDDDEIEIEVYFERDEVKVIDELEDYVEELKEQLEEEEEEEDDDDN